MRSNGGTFDVQTPLGVPLARDVIVATNGYADKSDMGWFARGKRIITSGRTGKAMPLRAKADLLRKDLIAVFAELADVKVGFAWSGYCAAPFDTMPKVGRRPDGVWYCTGFTFMGMPQGSYFGRKVALKMLGHPEGETIYANTPFRAPPLYNGNPWFLGPLMTLVRAKDRFYNR